MRRSSLISRPRRPSVPEQASTGFAGVDDELVALVRAGDVQGLAGLFDRHGDACLQAAAAALQGAADVETMVFDVFLATWREPPRTGTEMRQQLVSRTLDRVQANHP
jgi:hypothetical protein